MLVTEVLMRRISPSRSIAFEALEAVNQGGYVTDVLLYLSRSLDSRDASLASQIVFGSLRYQGQLDYLIELYSGRAAADLDLPVILSLRAAIFQLRYLDRIPPHAAVHESVEFVKMRKRAATGMVNAVLRKVNRQPVPWPDKATELSCPSWLLQGWTKHFGREQAEAIAAAALVEPVPYIRIPPHSHAPPGVEIEPTAVEGCFRVLRSSLPDGSMPPELRLHDISSQAIIPMLDLRAGQTYLDVCSAPGNKTLQALETPLGLAIAADISSKRLKEVPPVAPRVVLDGTRPLPFSHNFDRIFVDAPCSGTGTLSRNPEIKWRVQAVDLPRFAERQTAIVKQALRLLAPGGALLYATCSLETEENEQVVAAALAKSPGRRLIRDMWRLPGRDEGDGFYTALLA
jgi:16S rRNA (cytosine967-C5)-methyltransferase